MSVELLFPYWNCFRNDLNLVNDHDNKCNDGGRGGGNGITLLLNLLIYVTVLHKQGKFQEILTDKC